MVCGVWCVVCDMVCGMWCVVCGVWCVGCGAWCVGFRVWNFRSRVQRVGYLAPHMPSPLFVKSLQSSYTGLYPQAPVFLHGVASPKPSSAALGCGLFCDLSSGGLRLQFMNSGQPTLVLRRSNSAESLTASTSNAPPTSGRLHAPPPPATTVRAWSPRSLALSRALSLPILACPIVAPPGGRRRMPPSRLRQSPGTQF